MNILSLIVTFMTFFMEIKLDELSILHFNDGYDIESTPAFIKQFENHSE